MKSYNQVLAVFQAIATHHQMIKSYGSGDPAFIAEGIQYPLMWVTPDSASIGIDNEGGNNAKPRFQIMFADLVNEGGTNQNEILSDQLAIALDVIAQLQLSDYSEIFTVESTGQAEPFLPDLGKQATSDFAAGWWITVTLRLDYLSDQCGVPSTLNPSSGVGCPSVTIYDEAGNVLATVAAGGSYTEENTDAVNSAGTIIGTGRGIITLADKVFTDYDGTTSALVQGLNKSATQLTRVYAGHCPTGNKQSYLTGDDIWQENNVFNTLPTIGYRVKLATGSFFTLDGNNVYGNTNRFTDDLGLQLYASGLIIDHFTGYRWYRTLSSTSNWDNAVANALSFSITANSVTYSDWGLPNRNIISGILSQNVDNFPNNLGYSPFSITGSQEIWTSTTSTTTTSSAYYLLLGSGQPQLLAAAKSATDKKSLYFAKHF